MKICIICEGCYPYITGGVSSWIQMLIKQLPEHEFIICAINANDDKEGDYRYELPKNISRVYDIYLNYYEQENKGLERACKIKKDVIDDIRRMLENSLKDFNKIFETLISSTIKSISSFMKSYELLDAIIDVYKEKYSNMGFTSFYWTTRAMLLPFISSVYQGIPEADLYHSVSTGYAGIMGALGKYLYSKPFILTEHGIYTREREEEIIKSDLIQGYYKDMWIDHFKSLSGCAYYYADKVITLFERNREIQIELGCSDTKIKIIPNGVNINGFKSIPQKDENDPTINIGAVIRMVPIKDIKTMVQSFSLVKDKIPNTKFYIMGPDDEDEEYYSECLELSNSLEIEDLLFTGRVNIKEYIGKMDILVLTSISEGQPLAILEGMACGKPFVSTDVGSCKELLYGNGDDIGRAGLIAPVMDYEQIAQCIIELCKDKELREAMGKNALKRVSMYYTIEKFIDGYREIYNEYEVNYGGDRI